MTADEAAFFVQNGLTLGDPVLEEAAIRYHLLPIYDEFVLSPLVRSGLVQSNDSGFVIIDRTEQVVRNIETDIALNGSTGYTPVATLAKTAGITGAVVIIAIIPGPEDVAIAGTLLVRGSQVARVAAVVDDVADVTRVADQAATGFKGRKGFELKNAPYQKVRNEATSINGREFTSHALDQMQNRGIVPSVVENAIKTGNVSPGKIEGRIVYRDSVNNVSVITDAATGRVITVRGGQ